VSDSVDLTQLESHFAFGENWADYSKTIGQEEIAEAVKGLERLLTEPLSGKRFLDIGCGSGLHSLAAIRLGAAEVVSVDLDAEAIATTKAVLAKHAGNTPVRVEQISVFDLSPTLLGHFDVVYSWGVLHHTGDMYRAMSAAAAMVGPKGAFTLALYRKTWCCSLWRLEKRWYRRASPQAQSAARAIYIRLLAMRLRLRGVTLKHYLDGYRRSRGMNYHHDLHDWMGGYPYESISPSEVERFMRNAGFYPARVYATQGRVFGRDSGIFGSGCDEYTYVRD
jgi:2-polyprenyl-6-hydroxyphenyl methylase/3-demethylubiquinone-9 3-methyltransferase